MDVHQGKRIREVAASKGISINELAIQLGLPSHNVRYYIERKTQKVKLLQNIGKALNHDFISEFYLPSEIQEILRLKPLERANEIEELIQRLVALLENRNQVIEAQRELIGNLKELLKIKDLLNN